MKEDQKINADAQSEDANNSPAEDKNLDTKTDSASQESEQIKEVTEEEKIKELEDKITRTFAEMENQRRRYEKEKEDAFSYGGFAFAKETLNLIDNLERSKQILENDESLKNTEALKKTLEHFNIITKDMVSILSKNGITPINSIGQKEPGTIIQEIQKGFMMKDRLLRPSLVGVSKKSEQKEVKSEENKENSDN